MAAGNARFTAVVKSIPNVIAVNDQIVIAFTRGAIDQPMINGIEIQNAPPAGSAPTITSAPANATVAVGATATFTVTAGGTGPFTYQWLKGGTPIAGATSASYTTRRQLPPTTAACSALPFVTQPRRRLQRWQR